MRPVVLAAVVVSLSIGVVARAGTPGDREATWAAQVELDYERQRVARRVIAEEPRLPLLQLVALARDLGGCVGRVRSLVEPGEAHAQAQLALQLRGYFARIKGQLAALPDTERVARPSARSVAPRRLVAIGAARSSRSAGA